MAKDTQGAPGTGADVTSGPGPRQGLVHFPLAGDLDRGLGAVRVIDWGQPVRNTRMTLAGPVAHGLGKDDEIEGAIRTERLCGGCRPTATEGQLMVELIVTEGQQVSGASYTLALALADKLARGCLPRLAGRAAIASGHVQHDGSVAPVGRIAEKLAVVERALARRPSAAPLLVLARANLKALTADEQRLLKGLMAAGVRCEGVATLAEMGADWPREPTAEPSPSALPPRSHGVPRMALLAVGLGVALSGVALYLVRQAPDPCASLSADPAIVARCWGPLPLTVGAACRVERQGGYRPWRPCPNGTCLAGPDQFRLELRPSADGWLYAFHLDAADQVLEDLWPERTGRPVRAGETLFLPPAGRSFHIDGRASEERFFALLTRRPLPALGGPVDSTSATLAELLATRAETFAVCRDPLVSGRQ